MRRGTAAARSGSGRGSGAEDSSGGAGGAGVGVGVGVGGVGGGEQGADAELARRLQHAEKATERATLDVAAEKRMREEAQAELEERRHTRLQLINENLVADNERLRRLLADKDEEAAAQRLAIGAARDGLRAAYGIELDDGALLGRAGAAWPRRGGSAAPSSAARNRAPCRAAATAAAAVVAAVVAAVAACCLRWGRAAARRRWARSAATACRCSYGRAWAVVRSRRRRRRAAR